MRHTDIQETDVKQKCAITDQTTPAQEMLAREVLERLSGKWAFYILHVLEEGDELMRFMRVLEAVEGISQKVLTRMLRQLEADGFVRRKVFAEVPPRVEYDLTSLGADLLMQIAPLFVWVLMKTGDFAEARATFGS